MPFWKRKSAPKPRTEPHLGERDDPGAETESRLIALGEEVRACCRRHPGLSAHDDPLVYRFYLAKVFQEDVSNGGFARLLYGLQGNHLKEIEEMLIEAEAESALEHYQRAIEVCAGMSADYHAWLASGFREPHPVKDQLHLVSIDYFRAGRPFALEAREFILRCEPGVRHWIACVDAARNEPVH